MSYRDCIRSRRLTRVYRQEGIYHPDIEHNGEELVLLVLEGMRCDFTRQFCAYPQYLVVTEKIMRLLKKVSDDVSDRGDNDWVLRHPLIPWDGNAERTDKWVIANIEVYVQPKWDTMEEKARNNQLFDRTEVIKMEAFLTDEQARAINRCDD